MTFSWVQFLREYSIPHVTEGPNVARNNVCIKCPFCHDDPSEHMGLHTRSTSWACWRNAEHRGRSPVRLIRALLGCSRDEALQLSRGIGVPDDITQVHALLDEPLVRRAPRTTVVRLRREFRPLSRTGAGRRFYSYLRARGFSAADIDVLSDTYNVRYAISGPQRNRIIIPLHTQRGKLIGWTGRAVDASPRIRYLSHPRGPTIKRFVMNAHRIRRCRRVYIVEGPFDCLKVDLYGAAYGVRAVAVLGSSITDSQFGELLQLRRRCREMLLLPDSDAAPLDTTLLNLLDGGVCIIGDPAISDPGDMSGKQVVQHLCRKEFNNG